MAEPSRQINNFPGYPEHSWDAAAFQMPLHLPYAGTPDSAAEPTAPSFSPNLQEQQAAAEEQRVRTTINTAMAIGEVLTKKLSAEKGQMTKRAVISAVAIPVLRSLAFRGVIMFSTASILIPVAKLIFIASVFTRIMLCFAPSGKENPKYWEDIAKMPLNDLGKKYPYLSFIKERKRQYSNLTIFAKDQIANEKILHPQGLTLLVPSDPKFPEHERYANQIDAAIEVLRLDYLKAKLQKLMRA
jgi:hypothetical protein